jgi:hypothetical protein
VNFRRAAAGELWLAFGEGGLWMGGFPPAAVNDEESRWHCPALGQVIDHGLCWECCFAGGIGPRHTKEQLLQWIEESERFVSLEQFHQVCASCKHCQWSRG